MHFNREPLKTTFVKISDCEHEEQTEDIKPRDIVADKSGREMLVTCVKGNTVYCINRAGEDFYVYAMSELTKTGKRMKVSVEKEYRVKEQKSR